MRRLLKQAIAENKENLKIRSESNVVSREFGGSLVSINIINDSDEDAVVHVVQVLPSAVQPLFHTISLASGGVPSSLSIHPSTRQRQSAWFSADVAVAANTHEKITLEVIAPLQRVTDYSSDPYKGIELPGCIVKLGSRNADKVMLSTPFPMLQGYHSWINTPLPDFSMVYNVPVIAATVLITLLIPMVRMLLKPMRVLNGDK